MSSTRPSSAPSSTASCRSVSCITYIMSMWPLQFVVSTLSQSRSTPRAATELLLHWQLRSSQNPSLCSSHTWKAVEKYDLKHERFKGRILWDNLYVFATGRPGKNFLHLSFCVYMKVLRAGCNTVQNSDSTLIFFLVLALSAVVGSWQTSRAAPKRWPGHSQPQVTSSNLPEQAERAAALHSQPHSTENANYRAKLTQEIFRTDHARPVWARWPAPPAACRSDMSAASSGTRSVSCSHATQPTWRVINHCLAVYRTEKL